MRELSPSPQVVPHPCHLLGMAQPLVWSWKEFNKARYIVMVYDVNVYA